MTTQRIQLLLLALLLVACAGTSAATLEDQRRDYQAARKLLNAGKTEAFLKLAQGLEDYVLYPYLQYSFLQRRLSKVAASEMQSFFARYEDFPKAGELRARWLKQLARNRQWQDYYDNYTPQEDLVLQCNFLLARINTGHQAMLLEDIRSVWLSGSSLPPDCNPVFAYLYKSEFMTSELAWERFRLAMDKNNPGLARHVARYLNKDHKQWADLWLKVYGNPAGQTGDPHLEDTVISREILAHAIRKLARQNLNVAIRNWESILQRYSYAPGERTAVDRLLGASAARKKHAKTVDLLERVENYHVDEEILHWRIVTSLRDGNWQRLRRWTEGVPRDENLKYRWMYWHGRALEQTGAPDKAAQIYGAIAAKRDYYGFLAADRLGIPYNMEHEPLPDNPAEKQKIAALPGIQRAQELVAIGEKSLARREWNHALDRMTSYQQKLAAALASDWGWYGEAILTMGHAHLYNDLEVRFPIPYRSLLDEYAHKRQLDQGWMFALVRSESAFIEDARSPAGALGLMQVMPNTGKLTARQIGIRNFRAEHLLSAEKNVPIGSAYLKQMLDRFDGNMVLATAAYNAGPGRVRDWLPKQDCMDPDVWAELIPFTETRKYVRRVMFYASIYDWRLQRAVVTLHQRMPVIAARSSKQKLVAQLSCGGMQVSYN